MMFRLFWNYHLGKSSTSSARWGTINVKFVNGLYISSNPMVTKNICGEKSPFFALEQIPRPPAGLSLMIIVCTPG